MTLRADGARHHRRSIRLRGYDYAREGAYFVTVCTGNRVCLFGDIVEGEMWLNEIGGLVQAAWNRLPDHYPHVELDAWVIMPNHVHGIVVLTGGGTGTVSAGNVGFTGDADAGTNADAGATADFGTADAGTNADAVGAGFKPAPTTTITPKTNPPTRHGLSEIIRAFKTFSARRINVLRGTAGISVWQRSYYEHVIRNDGALERIRQYIARNPARWTEDAENPARLFHASGASRR